MSEYPGEMDGGEVTRVKEGEPVAQFEVDMARHSIKGKLPDGREPIIKEGMEAAVQAGLKNVRESVGKIYGSPRERTGQSSALRMLAERFKDMDFSSVDPEDIVRWLQEGGLEKTETPFLNFQTGEGAYTDEFMKEFKAGELLKWLTEKSDEKAIKTKQNPEKVTPFSVQAGNVAEFIFAKVWEVYDSKGGSGTAPVDFATSHQSVLECFLYKVIKNHDGEKAAEEFVARLKNKGFDENQGFVLKGKVYDLADVSKWSIQVIFDGKTYEMSPDELFGIIKEGQDLKEKLEEGQEK